MERIPIISNPKLFDLTVARLQTKLGNRISWLDHIFGIAEKCEKMIDGRKYITANVFIGNEQYAQIEPCDELGNFCFFVLRDPQELVAKNKNVIFSPFSAILWYDMRKLSFEPNSRNREAVKVQILQAFSGLHLDSGRVEINRIYESPESVFSGFSYEQINNQFLMSPYAGLRLDGKIWAEVPCAV